MKMIKDGPRQRNYMDSKRKNKPGQGRKPIGKDRGGLVPGNVQLFADQIERLNQEGQGKGWLVRAAVDQLIAHIDKQKKLPP